MQNSFHRFLAIVFACSATLAFSDETQRLPNVVIFLADDQGWGDLGCHGNTNLSTPNLDSLTKDGTRLENFYVCAVCAPTRAEFLTGRYHPKTGVRGVSEGSGRLNPDETTLADLFKASGYATGIFGKWHNGTQAPYHPNDRGFDEFYGFTSGHWGHYFSPPLDHNRTRVKGKGYLTDDLTTHAINFIKTHHDQPFLCYVPLNTPHSPFYVSDDFYAKFEDADPPLKNRDPKKEDLATTRAALAMCENIDWNVGRVLQTLDKLDLQDDTIVIYFSDNGPNSFRWNAGMKGKKGNVDEGGLRSPFLIRWPGRIAANRTLAQVTGAIDLLPTLTELTGIEANTAKPIDGRSMAKLLLDESSDWPERHLYSVWGRRATVRTPQFRMDEKGALFDITKDRGQLNDVSKQHPDVTTKLEAALSAHRMEMKTHFDKNADRPFTVGYHTVTTLPARDGIPHGTIKRSSKAPNNSFFTNWTDAKDAITWEIQTGTSGNYKATVYYTCAEANVGTRVRLSLGSESTEAKVTTAFDPPLWDKSKERVSESHYFVKDFKALELGTFAIKEGRGQLRLTCPEIIGDKGIDVYSIILEQTP